MRAQSFHFRKPVFLRPGQEFTQTGGLGPDFPAFAAAGFPGEAMKNFRETQKKSGCRKHGNKAGFRLGHKGRKIRIAASGGAGFNPVTGGVG